jgi:ketosteroid isomerase-like protein
MSREENVEIIRRSFEAFESMDVERWVSDWAEDVEFDVTGYEPWKGEQKRYTGQLAVLEFFGSMMAGIKVLKVDVQRVEAVDDDRVIAIYTETRQEPGHPPHDVPVGIVYTLRDAKLAHVEVYSEPAAALRAAGLPTG